MILRPFVAVGALAVQASAFLIPLEIANEVEKAKVQLESLWTNNAHTIELACPGCAFPGPQENGIPYSESDENTIELKILVQDDASLQINGETIFSLESPAVRPTILTAPQIRTFDSTPSRPVRLGYVLELLPAVAFTEGKGAIIPVQFTVLDLEGVSVHVDTIKIEMYHNVGGLTIAKISNIPFAQSPGASECTTSLCRLRAIVTSRVRTMMEAAKSHAQAAGAWAKAKGGCKGKKFGGNTAQRPAHHSHHGHHKMHRFGHILRQTLRFFIIPALLGVIGGLMASAVGMLVGQALVYLWFRFHHGGQRGNIRIIEVALTDDEKEALVEGGELPPQYEDIEAILVADTKE